MSNRVPCPTARSARLEFVSSPAEAARDSAVASFFERHPSGPDPASLPEIVALTTFLADRCARRFTRRGEPLDDLSQVAAVGLLKAISRFDPRHGAPFGAFAMPTIMGELRRHFRDRTWIMHVPRREKDLIGLIDAAGELLAARLRRPASPAELAAHLSMAEDRVVAIVAAATARRTMPLDSSRVAAHTTPDGDGTSPQDVVLDRLEMNALLEMLSERSRRVVELRYFEELTQREIATILGLSQVHVGRLLASGLATLRSKPLRLRQGAA